MTRSILAENSPYYESGIRLTYTTDNDHWSFAALLLNGWQRIRPLRGIGLQHIGTQISFTPSSSLTLNYSSFWGSDTPDSDRLFRHFHNLYVISKLSERFTTIAGLDIGFQQKQRGSSSYNSWYSYVGILRYQLTKKMMINIRGEMYVDLDEVLISTPYTEGFYTRSASINVDYQIWKRTLIRVEARKFNSRTALFPGNDRNYLMFTGSVSTAF